MKPDSPVKSIRDFKGRKIGYTNPRSTSQALAILLLQATGYKPDDAELIKTGGFGEGVAALDLGLIDVAPMAEPVWSKYKTKYRAVAVASDILPPLDNVVGVTTGAAMASKGDFIRAVIRARRKAVEFMHANPDEAGDIVAKHYNIDKEVARSAVRNLTSSRTQGIPYWGSGQIHLDGMKRMVEVQKMVGAISGKSTWRRSSTPVSCPTTSRRRNSACSGKVGTGFPVRTCAKSKKPEGIAIESIAMPSRHGPRG